MHTALVLAAGTPPEVGAAGISVSLTVALCVVAWIGTKLWGWKWTTLVVGVCIGHVAGGFVGDLAESVISIGVHVVHAATAGFG